MIHLLLFLLSSGSGPASGAWWVFLSDRGPDAGARVEAFTASLGGRCLARRLGAGLPEVADSLDLEPWPGYVAGIEAVLGPGRIRTESRYLDAVSFEGTREEAEALLSLPFVSGIRPVAASAFTTPDILPSEPNDLSQGQLEQAGVTTLIERGLTGSGVSIGVLDTGFNLSHAAFSDMDIIDQYDFINDDPVTGWQPGDPENQATHGTATLSIIGGFEQGVYSGAARGASFALAKTEDMSDEYPEEEDFWVEGLEWLDLQGASLVSSSLGYIDWYGWEDLDGNTAVTTIAADMAASRGMPVVNAIGNFGPLEGTLIAPSDGDSVFAVGGVDALGAPAEFSSRGPTWDGRIKPDVCARGVYVIVAQDAETGYAGGNGTSFAAPMVSGAAALLLEAHQEWTSMEALEALGETASQASSPDNVLGRGIIDATAACMYRSVTGSVRRSDTGDLLPGYPLLLDIGGRQHSIAAGPGGWFSFCPDTTGFFTIAGAGGEGMVLTVSGTLGTEGVEIAVFVDFASPGLAPSAFPVPSSGGVWVGFDIDRQADVVLRILSLSGGEVAEIERTALAPGSYRAPMEGVATYWDGCSEDGEPVASGLYYALLDIGGAVRVLKLALVR